MFIISPKQKTAFAVFCFGFNHNKTQPFNLVIENCPDKTPCSAAICITNSTSRTNTYVSICLN